MNDALTPELIARCALLHRLEPVQQQAVLAAGREYLFTSGDFLFHQGDDASVMYIICSGRIKLSQVTPEGNQIIVNYFGPGAELGIIVALSDMPYPLSAQAVEDCRLVGWSPETIKGLMRPYPQLTLNGLEMVARRFASLQDRYQEMATQRVEQRIARALLRLVRQFGKRVEAGVLIDLPLTREDLAQMTGTNLFSVSRTLSKWDHDGIIITGRRRITLADAHRLVIIAEDL